MSENGNRELHPAEIAKAEAEARKADAEAEAARVRAEAEAKKFEAEARMAAAEAEEAELKLVKARYDADREVEKRREELSADKYHQVYYFKGGVDDTSAHKCIEQLRHWHRTVTDDDKKHATIVFYSPGGSVFAGFALYDYITLMQADGWHFTTDCRSYAASMGSILLQAGDKRVMAKESYVLIHEISSGAVGKIGELEDEMEFLKLVQDRVWDIFVSRSNGKLTKAKLKAMVRRKDLWLDSSKCLRLGVVDEVR